MKLRGKLGEAITKELFMDNILTEISKRSGVPKDRLEVIWLGEIKSGGERPDFVLRVTGTTTRLAVIEVKYVGDVEDIESFGGRIDEARLQVRGYMASSDWVADYGIAIIVTWSPEQILGDEPCPPKVGGFKNPYIEYFSKEGG